MYATEPDLSPEDRFHELAGIFAIGILRLKSRPQGIAGPADPADQETSNSAEKPLGLRSRKRLYVLTG